MVDDYLQQLVEEGDLDSHGRITLDPSKARQKLADSRFSHSSEALLAVVAAYLLAGAREIRITHQRDGWQFCSDAQPPAPADLANLMQDMFSNCQAPALRELALAFNSLYPKQYRSLELIVGGEQRGWFEEGEWKTQPIPGVSGFSMQLTLHRHPSLREWWKWLTRRWARLSDLQILQARTRWSPSPVRFQQGADWPSSYELDPPALPPGTLATMHLECPIPGLGLPPYAGNDQFFCHHRLTRARTTLRCALLPGDPRQSQILLVYRGLILARHLLPGNVVRFHGVINTDSLDLDASRQHVVQNQRLRQRAETARQWVLEGTAAWLNQLDPASLTPELLGFLTELLLRLNNSAGHKQLLAALHPMPLLLRGEGLRRMSLAELTESLVRFPALHTGRVNSLHDRPILHPEHNPVKRLSSLLRVPVVDATPWVRQFQQDLPAEWPAQRRYTLRGHDWEAGLHFSSAPGINRLAMRLRGHPFLLQTESLFDIPTSLAIYLDGTYDGPLDVALKRVQDELKAAILAAVEGWLQEMRLGVHDSFHLEHYAGLLCLWMRGETGKPRTPTPEMLEYGVVYITPEGNQAHSLATLVQDQEQLAQLPADHPARLLAQWL